VTSAALLLLARPRQALPRVVAPFQDETVESYERRLAAANHVTIEDLRVHAGQQPGRCLDAADLEILTNLPRETLLLALPELREKHPDPGLPPAGRLPSLPHRRAFRPVCRRCVAARGITAPVLRWAANDDNVCLKHNLWTGPRANHVDDQIDVAMLPDVIAAQRRHRNLTRRHGRLRTTEVYHEAAHITFRWTLQGHWPDTRTARLRALTGSDLDVRSDDPLLRLINYPETVGLISLFLSSYWHRILTEASSLHLSQEGDRFLAEVRHRTGITDYEFGGTRDPLNQWCERRRLAARLDAKSIRDFDLSAPAGEHRGPPSCLRNTETPPSTPSHDF
jgi:TniQ